MFKEAEPGAAKSCYEGQIQSWRGKNPRYAENLLIVHVSCCAYFKVNEL